MRGLSRNPQRLRARWVVPIDAPPIENGDVVIDEDRIVFVGPADGTRAADRDFGACALLPGLVNVHSHLEYTVFRGLLEDIAFFPWIRELTRLKPLLTPDDWTASATLGAAEMLAAGITTIADCADAGASLAALDASGQRGIVFREVFGIAAEPDVPAIVDDLRAKLAAMTPVGDRVALGISPHAPYTVRPALFTALARFAAENGLRQAIHVAESPAEVALIADGSGPFAEMFARRGIDWKASETSPTRHIDASGGFNAPTLAVHCVHVDRGDADVLAARGASVAHCPKSNGKLGAGFSPVRMLLDAGLAVGLGTDSVASNNNADLFEEMRAAIFCARSREHDTTALTAREALEMATIGGARALGLDARIGTLTPGKRADLCAVRVDGTHVFPAGNDDPVAALVYSARASDVVFTMIDGQAHFDGGAFPTLDVAALRRSVGGTRQILKEATNHRGGEA